MTDEAVQSDPPFDSDAVEPAERADAPAVPATPRPISSRAKRRSWAELPVRPWLLLSGIVALITIYFFVSRIMEVRSDRWLIQNGTPVDAQFIHIGGDTVPKPRPRYEPLAAAITFALDGKPVRLDIMLDAKPGAERVQIGKPFPIRVDPNNPERWTEQTEPRAWLHELAAAGLLVPLLVLVILVAWLRRMQMLRTWRDAPLMHATVVASSNTPGAPRSRIVLFTLTDAAEKRVWKMLLPVRAGIPRAGEGMWLICPEANPSRAVAASVYIDI